MTRLFFFELFALIFFSFNSFSADLDLRVSQLETHMRQVRTKTESNTYGAKTGLKKEDKEGVYGVSIGLGTLYQTALLGGAGYSYTNDHQGSQYPKNGELRQINNTWSFGVNGTLSYQFPHDGEQVSLYNCFYNQSSSNSVSSAIDSSILQLKAMGDIIPASSFFYCNQAKSSLDITYDLLSLELARDFYLSQYLSIRPNTGLLSSWVWLKNQTSYSGGLDLGGNRIYVEDRTNWYGIGPKLGVDLVFGLGHGISFFGEITGSLLYGRNKVLHQERYSANDVQVVNIQSQTHTLIPYSLGSIGFCFESSFFDDKNLFKFRVAYQNQIFVGMNQMIQVGGYSLEETYADTIQKQAGSLVTSGFLFDLLWSF
ncbi:MAG: hypothetical protein EBU93_04660 [Chlamydiae bacterium]|nr:hypothetical protein [Chlamydiota bacterium]